MTNPDDYYIHRKIWVRGPHFEARGATPLEAENFLRLIQDFVHNENDHSIAVARQRRQTRTARKERDEAFDQVKALQDEVNRLEAELQKDKRDAAHFQECLKAEETAHRLCFRKMKDLEEQVQKGLPSGLQVTPVSDGPTRDKALARVAGIEARLDEIKACCSAAHYAASDLRDSIEQGGAK